jgi:hypothetical protein
MEVLRLFGPKRNGSHTVLKYETNFTLLGYITHFYEVIQFRKLNLFKYTNKFDPKQLGGHPTTFTCSAGRHVFQ